MFIVVKDLVQRKECIDIYRQLRFYVRKCEWACGWWYHCLDLSDEGRKLWTGLDSTGRCRRGRFILVNEILTR